MAHEGVIPKYATCRECGLKMRPGNSCTANPAGDRIPWGEERHGGQTMEEMFGERWRAQPWNCHDCNAAPGGLHHPGCDSEECPRCGDQAAFCGHRLATREGEA